MSLNILDLKAEIARCDLTIPKLADMIGMDKKTLYSRINGETSFKQTEIVKISQVLNLTEEKIMAIFLRPDLQKRQLRSCQNNHRMMWNRRKILR